MHTHVKIALVVVAALASLPWMLSNAQLEPRAATTAKPMAEPLRDLTRGYQAWVFCIDTSTSVQPDQFNKIKAAMRTFVDIGVRENDIVWLIEIGGGQPNARQFQMPVEPTTRSAKQTVGPIFLKSKNELSAAIEALEQHESTTNLYAPIEWAVSILRPQESAYLRTLVVGSDFLEDREPGTRIPTPTPPADLPSAPNLRVRLLFGSPTDRELKRVHMTRSELLANVTEHWPSPFKEKGVTDIVVLPADAIPASRRLADQPAARR